MLNQIIISNKFDLNLSTTLSSYKTNLDFMLFCSLPYHKNGCKFIIVNFVNTKTPKP
jgi:hypothetical protein